MARRNFIDVIRFLAGFVLARPKIEKADSSSDYAADGSYNVIFTGQGKPYPFKGLTEVVGSKGGVVSAQVSDGVGALTDIP